MSRTKEQRDGGFTLVELVIVLALTGILTGVLATAATVVFGNSDATIGRMSGSHDAQLANAYFADDVAQAGLWTDLNTITPTRVQAVEKDVTSGCGASGASPAVLRLSWDDYSGGTATRVRVAYSAQTHGPERQLVRIECNGAATPVETVVANHLATTGPGPTVTCLDSAGATTSCTSAAGPARIDLVVDIADPDDPNPFSVTLSGQRRQI